MSERTIFSRSVSIGKIKSKVEEYKSRTKVPTYSGLLRYLGIGTYEWRQIEQFARNGNDKYVALLKVLDNFKLDLEVKMEEYLLYQGMHPDLVNVPNYNYKHLEWLLKVSNPKKYGGAWYDIGGKPNEKALNKIMPKNESGVSLLGTNKNS